MNLSAVGMELSARDGTGVFRGLWYGLRINKLWLAEHVLLSQSLHTLPEGRDTVALNYYMIRRKVYTKGI